MREFEKNSPTKANRRTLTHTNARRVEGGQAAAAAAAPPQPGRRSSDFLGVYNG